MIKILLAALLIMSVLLNVLMWSKIENLTHSLDDINNQKTVEINEDSNFVTGENTDIIAIDNEVNQKTPEINKLESEIQIFNILAGLFDWDKMLDQMSIIDALLESQSLEEQEQTHALMSEVWKQTLLKSKEIHTDDQWVDAMLRYIDRKPEDLELGYVYVQYLVQTLDFEQALLYVNFLEQVSSSDTDSKNLKMKFDQYVFDYLKFLNQEKNYTASLSLLNVVLQYEVLNVPLLIEKTQIQINIGDFAGATETLGQFEYELQYQTQVELFKNQINNAPKDRSIKLQEYGEQFIVNTLFDDGYSENTVPLLIDTGASISVISESIFERYVNSPNIKFIKAINVDTAGGRVQSNLYEIERIQIGEFEVLNTQFMVIALAQNKPYQGLLGMSFLKHFDFDIDQKMGLLHLK